MRILHGFLVTSAAIGALASTSCSASDGAASDAGRDGTGTAADADDAGPTGDGAPGESAACRPGSVAGFQPASFVPGILSAPRACDGFGDDGGFVQSIGDACLGHAATYDTCAAVALADAAGASACYDCLLTPQIPDASAYGASALAVVPIVNYAGCVQALDPSDAGKSCARALSDAYLCYEYACEGACSVTDEASRDAFVACVNEASTGACLAYSLAAQNCMLVEQGDGGSLVGSVCFGGSSAEDHFLSVAHHFCGGD